MTPYLKIPLKSIFDPDGPKNHDQNYCIFYFLLIIFYACNGTFSQKIKAHKIKNQILAFSGTLNTDTFVSYVTPPYDLNIVFRLS